MSHTPHPLPDEALAALNQPGRVVEITCELAELLGAFEETALSEQDAEAADQELAD